MRQALYAILSKKLADGELKFVTVIPATGKTKEVFTSLKGFFGAKRQLPATLLVSATKNGSLVRAARNLARVSVLPGSSLNITEVLNAKNVLVEKEAVAEIK